jgi:hypothetical protein
MKQGRATTSVVGSTKVEPNSKAVNVEAVAEIGLQYVRANSAPMYEGRGLEAPMAGCTTHVSGSQGKH